MTKTGQLLFDNYTVMTGTPTVRNGWINGEFILTGKRGATYTTTRKPSHKVVQFRAASGAMAALYGNYHLQVSTVAEYAVTLTDADRV